MRPCFAPAAIQKANLGNGRFRLDRFRACIQPPKNNLSESGRRKTDRGYQLNTDSKVKRSLSGSGRILVCKNTIKLFQLEHHYLLKIFH